MSNQKVAKAQKKRADKLLKLGKLREAKEAYFEFCKIHPGDFQAWQSAGLISSRLNHFQDAAAAFNQALSLNPNLPELYFELAQAQFSLQQYLDADQNIRSFLVMRPDSGEGYWAYAKLLQNWGRISEATESYRKANELLGNDAAFYIDFGSLLQKQGMYDEALEQFKKAQDVDPEFAQVYYRLATLYRDTQQFDSALHHYNKAFELAPADEAIYHFYLGSVSESKGDTADALSHYDKALALNNELPEAHLNKALCLLLVGKFKEGWAEYEWRLRCPDWMRQRHLQLPNIPLWNGVSWPGKTILVIAEQGYGDTFQFCRYLTLLAERFSKVVVYCKPEIAGLIKSVDGVDEVVISGQNVLAEHFDSYVYMMSLPHLFGSTLDTIPNKSPYIQVPTQLANEWQQRVCLDNKGFKVGLAWSGSPSNARNVIRKIPLSDLAPLGNVPGVRFFGLQKGPGCEEALSPPENMDFIDLSNSISDFSDTAAAIEGLDLVITVDSAVAHLAGALGKPVWVLLYTPPDWRYLIDREDSPWYPSMRIFRQDESRRWAPVIKRAANELQKIVSEISSDCTR